MKNTRIFLCLIAMVIFFNSCSKIQTTINKISGAWELISITENGSNINITGKVNQLYFEKCPMTYTNCEGNLIYNGYEESFIYSIGSDGNDNHLSTLALNEIATETEYTINKLDKDTLILSFTRDSKQMVFSFVKRK